MRHLLLFPALLLLGVTSCGKVRDEESADSGISGTVMPDGFVAGDGTTSSESSTDLGSGESGYRADGCPIYMSCGIPCTNVDEGKDCWYAYQCDTPIGSVQECVCEHVTKPEVGYMWRPKRSCDCPKDASAYAICD
jgi:hypothetical protein